MSHEYFVLYTYLIPKYASWNRTYTTYYHFHLHLNLAKIHHLDILLLLITVIIEIDRCAITYINARMVVFDVLPPMLLKGLPKHLTSPPPFHHLHQTTVVVPSIQSPTIRKLSQLGTPLCMV